MDDISGIRIRYNWSTQAASCLASTASNGYFVHPDFSQIACVQGESCFPGVRSKRITERLSDVLSVAQQLATPNSDPTYQANLNTARASSYLIIDGMGSGLNSSVALYGSLITSYDDTIDKLTAVLNTALPPSARTSVLDALCAPDSVGQLTDLENQCLDNGNYCDLITEIFDTIDKCDQYHNGARLTQLLSSLATTQSGLISERAILANERDRIPGLWSQIQSLHAPPTALPPACNIRYPFGVAQMPMSDFAGGHYGADLGLLYGKWMWTRFGLMTGVEKSTTHVYDVANLTRNCLGDPRYGRLDFTRHRVSDSGGGMRDETDPEYFARELDFLLQVSREFAQMEIDFPSLVHANTPQISDADIEGLKAIESATLLHYLDLAADRATGVGWIVAEMQDLSDALDRFTTAQDLTRELIAVYMHEFPGVRDVVIDMMINNTDHVLDEYGQFFSPDKLAHLDALLAAAEAEGDDDNLDQVTAVLSGIADDLQTEFDPQSFITSNQLILTTASKLKTIFGGCQPASPHPLVTRFSDLPVAARIVQEADNAALCSQ